MINIGQMVIENFQKRYEITRKDMGTDAVLKKGVMAFETETYDIRGYGHLCIMKTKAMLGLMKMETVILVPFEKDVPLIDFDYINVAGRETYLAEFYNCQLEKYPEEYIKELSKCENQYPELEEYDGGQHWYDAWKYYCSCARTARKSTNKFAQLTRAYITTFCRQIDKIGNCDRKQKMARIREYAETLVEKGGPAVNSFKKMFGEEKTGKIVIENMYGIEKADQ